MCCNNNGSYNYDDNFQNDGCYGGESDCGCNNGGYDNGGCGCDNGGYDNSCGQETCTTEPLTERVCCEKLVPVYRYRYVRVCEKKMIRKKSCYTRRVRGSGNSGCGCNNGCSCAC